MVAQREEERVYIEHAQAFFGQRGRGRNNRGGRGGFNSRGRGFTPAGRYNTQNEKQNSQGNNNQQQPNQNRIQQRRAIQATTRPQQYYWQGYMSDLWEIKPPRNQLLVSVRLLI